MYYSEKDKEEEDDDDKENDNDEDCRIGLRMKERITTSLRVLSAIP